MRSRLLAAAGITGALGILSIFFGSGTIAPAKAEAVRCAPSLSTDASATEATPQQPGYGYGSSILMPAC